MLRGILEAPKPDRRVYLAKVNDLAAKYDALAPAMLERMRSDGSVVHIRLDGGHALPLEQPAALAGVIASFAASFATRHG